MTIEDICYTLEKDFGVTEGFNPRPLSSESSKIVFYNKKSIFRYNQGEFFHFHEEGRKTLVEYLKTHKKINSRFLDSYTLEVLT